MNFTKKLKDIDIFNILTGITLGLVIFLVIFTAYEIYHKVPKVKENIELATTKKPETFTELYFENHLNLPSIIKADESYPFQFTIHNVEYKNMKYPYEVYIETDGKKEIIEKKLVILNHDNKVTIGESFTPKVATRSAVVVNLVNKNQEIRFWVEGDKK